MINREITYERDVHKSYMKIPAVLEGCFDEKLILQRPYQGCITMEKCYINGGGQYWYNITGKQALDAYCRVNTIGQGFLESLILRICSQLEQLEWNLIDSNCLMMEPELIFVNGRGEDISFTLYPSTQGNFWEELQQLIEYLLTKIDHKDNGAVAAAYDIYDIILSEEYSMSDLKEAVLKRKSTPLVAQVEEEIGFEPQEDNETIEVPFYKQIEEKLYDLCQKAKAILCQKKEELLESIKPDLKKKEESVVIYPREEEEGPVEICPTICLSSIKAEPEGRLVYEGFEGYPDYRIEEEICLIGKNKRTSMQIGRDTISQFHAKIECIDSNYYIEDLNSTNGTFINNKILNYKERRRLEGGEQLRFADVKYRFI